MRGRISGYYYIPRIGRTCDGSRRARRTPSNIERSNMKKLRARDEERLNTPGLRIQRRLHNYTVVEKEKGKRRNDIYIAVG